MSARRDLLLCLSFANLCFLDVWDSSPAIPFLKFVVPLLLAIAMLGVVLWIGGRLVGRCGRWIALAGLLFPLNLLRVHALHIERRDISPFVAVVAGSLIGFAVFRWREQFLRLPGVIALLMLPLAPIQLGYTAWRYVPERQGMSDPPATPQLKPSEPGAPRVAWLIFDELDQDLAFTHRPASLAMPEFERLRRESLFTDHAVSPAGTTRRSIPALIGNWRSSIFETVRKAGANVAIAGAELKYCDEFEYSVAACYAMSSAAEELALSRPTILDRTWHHLYTRVFPRRPLFDAATRRASREADIPRFQKLCEIAQTRAADPRFQLVYVHLPVPHLLAMWDRHAGTFSTSDSSSYLDNLALADRTLGQIRHALEAADLWDKTTVIATSDHPLRDFIIDAAGWWDDAETAALPRTHRKYVPFLVKLAGRRFPAEFHDEFNTRITRDLVLALLTGSVTTREQVEALLRRVP
jgi:hypothetical protein